MSLPKSVQRPITAARITDATEAGRDLLTAEDAAAQRELLSVYSTKVWEKVALSPNGAAIAAGTGKGFVPITVAGTITAVRIDLDPANEPTDQATLVDVNKVNRSTGIATSILTAAMSIATSANSATGTINGTQTVVAGDWLQVDVDQGSDGQDLICSIEITPS